MRKWSRRPKLWRMPCFRPTGLPVSLKQSPLLPPRRPQTVHLADSRPLELEMATKASKGAKGHQRPMGFMGQSQARLGVLGRVKDFGARTLQR